MKRMATKSSASITISAILGLVALTLIFFLPPPKPAGAKSSLPLAGKTGAPPGEGTCSDCHGDFAENFPGGSITLIGLPAAYTPGDTLTLGIAVARTAMIRWGFEVTALKAGDLAVGTFLDTNLFVNKTTANSREYMRQTRADGPDGSFAGQADAAAWTFDWIAPAAGAGTVTFYFSGVAADNDLSNGGDYVYTSSQSATEGSSTAVEATTWGNIKTIYR